MEKKTEPPTSAYSLTLEQLTDRESQELLFVLSDMVGMEIAEQIIASAQKENGAEAPNRKIV